MRKFLIALLILLAGFGLFLWYAAGPAISTGDFSSSGLLQFAATPETASSPSAPKEIKVLTYNIGYASGEKNNLAVSLSRAEVESNLGAMASSLKELKPDVVCLQEVDFQASRTFRINQMEYLSKALSLPYGAYVVTWNKRYLPWPYWPLQHQFGRIVSGQAILSRFPIEKHEIKKFPKPASNPFWYNWFYLERILEKLTLRIGNREVFLWNVHLEAFDPKARLTQAAALADWVQEEKSLFRIVAGDFNSVSQLKESLTEAERQDVEDVGESLKLLGEKTGLRNAESTTPFFTMPSWDPFKKIDHIFYDPKGFRLNAVGTLKALKASDHLPVWAVFRIQ